MAAILCLRESPSHFSFSLITVTSCASSEFASSTEIFFMCLRSSLYYLSLCLLHNVLGSETVHGHQPRITSHFRTRQLKCSVSFLHKCFYCVLPNVKLQSQWDSQTHDCGSSRRRCTQTPCKNFAHVEKMGEEEIQSEVLPSQTIEMMIDTKFKLTENRGIVEKLLSVPPPGLVCDLVKVREQNFKSFLHFFHLLNDSCQSHNGLISSMPSWRQWAGFGYAGLVVWFRAMWTVECRRELFILTLIPFKCVTHACSMCCFFQRRLKAGACCVSCCICCTCCVKLQCDRGNRESALF